MAEQPFRTHESDENRTRKLETLRETLREALSDPVVVSAALLSIGSPTAGQVLTVASGGTSLEWTTP